MPSIDAAQTWTRTHRPETVAIGVGAGLLVGACLYHWMKGWGPALGAALLGVAGWFVSRGGASSDSKTGVNAGKTQTTPQTHAAHRPAAVKETEAAADIEGDELEVAPEGALQSAPETQSPEHASTLIPTPGPEPVTIEAAPSAPVTPAPRATEVWIKDLVAKRQGFATLPHAKVFESASPRLREELKVLEGELEALNTKSPRQQLQQLTVVNHLLENLDNLEARMGGQPSRELDALTEWKAQWTSYASSALSEFHGSEALILSMDAEPPAPAPTNRWSGLVGLSMMRFETLRRDLSNRAYMTPAEDVELVTRSAARFFCTTPNEMTALPSVVVHALEDASVCRKSAREPLFIAALDAESVDAGAVTQFFGHAEVRNYLTRFEGWNFGDNKDQPLDAQGLWRASPFAARWDRARLALQKFDQSPSAKRALSAPVDRPGNLGARYKQLLWLESALAAEQGRKPESVYATRERVPRWSGKPNLTPLENLSAQLTLSEKTGILPPAAIDAGVMKDLDARTVAQLNQLQVELSELRDDSGAAIRTPQTRMQMRVVESLFNELPGTLSDDESQGVSEEAEAIEKWIGAWLTHISDTLRFDAQPADFAPPLDPDTLGRWASLRGVKDFRGLLHVLGGEGLHAADEAELAARQGVITLQKAVKPEDRETAENLLSHGLWLAERSHRVDADHPLFIEVLSAIPSNGDSPTAIFDRYAVQEHLQKFEGWNFADYSPLPVTRTLDPLGNRYSEDETPGPLDASMNGKLTEEDWELISHRAERAKENIKSNWASLWACSPYARREAEALLALKTFQPTDAQKLQVGLLQAQHTAEVGDIHFRYLALRKLEAGLADLEAGRVPTSQFTKAPATPSWVPAASTTSARA